MEKTIAEELNQNFVPVQEVEEIEQPQKVSLDFGFLKAPTGEGSISDYLDHPMNFNKSEGMSRILRGLTGMIGSLDLAIIDIVVGVLDLSKNRKGVIKHGADFN